MAEYRGIWRNTAGYRGAGEIPGDTGRYREIPGDKRYGEIRIRGDNGEIRGDTGRCDKMRGDTGRCGEIEGDREGDTANGIGQTAQTRAVNDLNLSA